MDDERHLSTADIAAGRDGDDADAAIERDPDAQTTAATVDPANEPLFDQGDLDRYRSRWMEVQGRFVDEPQASVHQADELVAELMQTLASQFSESRNRLEQQWSSNEDVSTEDLRQALMRYRSFFERLLAA
jgi:hypothetical protein